MGFLNNQFANVVEWEQFKDDMIFWKWDNKEIKKGSKLIIKPGQDAIFMFNGKVEGVFTDEGSYDIESQIVPFLSTLKGFKFGFNSGMRAEVLFINTKELTVKWGTKNAINIPTSNLPGGMPIKAFGTFSCKVDDHDILIEKIAGVKKQFTIEDVKERIMSILDQTFMRWVVREGRNIFNLQADAYEISNGVQSDLNTEMKQIGIVITNFVIANVSYPQEIQEMATKMASQSFVSDMDKYTRMAMADSMMNDSNGGNAGNMATTMASMQMGMVMGQQMVNQMAQNQNSSPQSVNTQVGSVQLNGSVAKFCPNCGTQNSMQSNFCPNCGSKLAL